MTSETDIPTPSREAGLSQLSAFLPYAGNDYARLRNVDYGPRENTQVSNLSPWIRHRLINEQEVVAATVSVHGTRGTEKFIQEACWRTYWKGWLEQHPSVWRDYTTALEEHIEEVTNTPELAHRLEAATSGSTGIECFDFWSRELIDTGYLHNHARMWFASIWIFTLKLPWELGADFFLRHLIDGDAASNTLSWRWVAGLQTRGKTYLARPDNIMRYTGNRFAPPVGLAQQEIAIQAPPPPKLRPLKFEPQNRPNEDAGLLLCEEDLNPEFLSERGWHFSTAMAVQATANRSILPTAPHVIRFARGSLEDALSRSGTAEVEENIPTRDYAAQIKGWAQRHKLSVVVLPYLPVGPTADALAAVWPTLKQAGIRVRMPVRDWDRLAWPACEGSFFKFWNKTGKDLANVNIGISLSIPRSNRRPST